MAWLSKAHISPTLCTLLLIIGLIGSTSSSAAVKVADEPVIKDAAVDTAEEGESCADDGSRVAYCVEFLQSGREARTCLDYLCRGRTQSGVYNVHPSGHSDYSLPVYCDQTTDGGGWTVFQRRMDGTVDFYRNWANYRLGFGELTAEHWLGNENLYTLLSLHDVSELWVDMQSANDLTSYARYDNFSIASESDNYTLSVSGFLGTADAGDGLTPLDGASFAAKDKDDNTNCAQRFQAGGWWYGIDSQTCYDTNLNGFYRGTGRRSYSDGVNWKQWKGYYGSLTFSEMKFRPKTSN